MSEGQSHFLRHEMLAHLKTHLSISSAGPKSAIAAAGTNTSCNAAGFDNLAEDARMPGHHSETKIIELF